MFTNETLQLTIFYDNLFGLFFITMYSTCLLALIKKKTTVFLYLPLSHLLMLGVTNIQDTKRLIGLYKSISYDVNLICFFFRSAQ